MLQVRDKRDCCGCEACRQVCPKQCITMAVDSEGFAYPKVDATACIDCHLCEKVCPVINQDAERKPISVLAAKNCDAEVVRKSSSGGVFHALATKVIEDGGVVFGARFVEDWSVEHSWTDTIEGIAPFMGSKYLQSRIGDSFAKVKEFLKDGRKVMFTGTPCQISGLKKFLRKDYDNLLAVDVICHGVPSPMVWQNYLKETLRPARGGKVGRNTVDPPISQKPTIVGISFRDKRISWPKFGLALHFAPNGSERNSVWPLTGKEETEGLFQPHYGNDFMAAFLRDLILRPSCYACPAKAGKSGSDLTIGDYWGIEKVMPGFADDKGVSVVVANTEKGARMIEGIGLETMDSRYEDALAGNPSLVRSVGKPINREYFWKQLRKRGLDEALERTFSTNILRRIERKLMR